VLILLPVALLLLVVLSTFTLFSYRNAIALLAAERQQEAARAARAVADRLAASPEGALPGPRDLREPAPSARGVALVDARGEAMAEIGELPAGGLLEPAGGRPVRQPLGVGPDDASPDAVVGFAPLAGGRFVRVDLPAGALARQRRSLAVLTVAVLSIDAGLAVLLLFFLRHLLAPWEMLLARARQVGGAGLAGEDEIELLLGTFDRALAALAGRQGRSAEDDIAALERTLSASLQSGLLLLDREGRVLALNAVGAALLGAALPEPGAPLDQVLAGQPELREILAAAVAEGTAPQRQECAVRHPETGETLTVGLTVHPLRRDDGEVRGLLVLFADLTAARRRAEESRLAESLAQLGEMAGGVAHELRNGLATLRGYLTLIERRPDEGSIADFLSEIRGEADHLERVLQDFLSFARPGTARLRDLELLPLLRRAAADPALAGVEVSVRGEDAALRGDPELLERAVRNLLHNAAQAEREAGRRGPVEVSVAHGGDGVEVAIEDRGPGLPDEIRARLFHPFATGRRGGVGLGLALAHRIVVLHGGRIRLEDRPGGGTRAVLTFPRDTIVTNSNEAPPSEALPPVP
ncbi:MAG TPA: ATP-binding protein, partial [Thermoanaerobaculia bacterium]